jgi:23S rRNA (pseudouridine1915-N3)-methyltransferase
MRLQVVFVGKTSFPSVDEGIQRYLERLQHYVPTLVHVLKAGKIGSKTSGETVKDLEAERILKLFRKEDYVAVWDERGKEHDSLAFAQFLASLQRSSFGNVWMVLGGPLGISRKVFDRANVTLSLSKMTFAHDLARLLVMEQLYRAFTILKGEPYHK